MRILTIAAMIIGGLWGMDAPTHRFVYEQHR